MPRLLSQRTMGLNSLPDAHAIRAVARMEPKELPMRVTDCCNTTIVVADRGTGVVDAARLMRENHVGSIVIVERDTAQVERPVGIVTDRDLVIEVLAEDVDPHGVTLGDIMGGDVVTAEQSDDLFETLDRMRDAGIRRVPVVDEDGGLSGILSVDDALDVLADALGRLPRLVRTEIETESVRRN
jgi:CBS domain-containing protein